MDDLRYTATSGDSVEGGFEIGAGLHICNDYNKYNVRNERHVQKIPKTHQEPSTLYGP